MMLPLLFWIVLFLAIYIILFPGREAWTKYAKLSEIKSDEKILYEENDVKIIEDSFLEDSSEYGFSSRGWRKNNVKITNQRIILFDKRNNPTGIVNYITNKEWIKPKWLYFYRGFFLNVEKKDMSFGKDQKECEYFEIMSKKGWRYIKRRYYFRDMDIIKKIFNV